MARQRSAFGVNVVVVRSSELAGFFDEPGRLETAEGIRAGVGACPSIPRRKDVSRFQMCGAGVAREEGDLTPRYERVGEAAARMSNDTGAK